MMTEKSAVSKISYATMYYDERKNRLIAPCPMKRISSEQA